MVDFAREVLGFDPTPRQAAILDEIERDHIRTAVLRLGRRSGKGRIGAIVATFEATANVAAHLGAVAGGEQVAIVGSVDRRPRRASSIASSTASSWHRHWPRWW